MSRSITTLALVIVLGASASVAAEETICRGTLGPRAFDSILVPDNARCTLNRSRVSGSIMVGRGASLQANGVRVEGDVQADGALQVGIGPGSRIGGSVQVRQGGGTSITGARISGDLQFDANALPLAATDNLVGGSIQVVKNAGGVTLERNHIESTLSCKANLPVPVGGQNLASSKEDQCAAM